MPDGFIEWYSGVKQLELGASREGHQKKKSLGNHTLVPCTSSPHGVHMADDPTVFVLKILFSHEWVTLGIALFTTRSWAITSVSGKA